VSILVFFFLIPYFLCRYYAGVFAHEIGGGKEGFEKPNKPSKKYVQLRIMYIMLNRIYFLLFRYFYLISHAQH